MIRLCCKILDVHQNFVFPLCWQTQRKGTPMHVLKLLHDFFNNACISVHKRLCKTLFSAVEALTRCKQLSITSLGRSLHRPISIKHSIKCMDRLFANSSLYQKRMTIYKALAHRLLHNNYRPVIIVDWSGLTPCGAFHFLSASVAIDGRSLTLYSEAYPLKKYASLETHLSFLKTLLQILPEHCKPTIITDAGFRNNWFSAVSGLGWDFVGRVRQKTLYSREHQHQWFPIKTLYRYASEKTCFIGRVVLSRSTQLDVIFI